MHKVATTLCIMIVGAVILNSLHGKDFLIAMPLYFDDSKNQTRDDPTQGAPKVGGDLHNHIDKAGKILGSDNPQSDTRSLRLLRDRRHNRNPMLDLFDTWRNYIGTYLR